MSSTIYNKAFSVELSHDFYEAVNKYKIHRYLEIVPTTETADLMKRGRMRFVRTETGLTVFYQSYKDSISETVKPLVEISTLPEFIFVVRIREQQDFIQNVTDLNVDGGVYRGGNLLALIGRVTSFPPPPYEEPLNARLIGQVLPSAFTYSFLPQTSGYTDPLTVTATLDGEATPAVTLYGVRPDPETGIYSVQIDLGKKPKGIYAIIARASIENTQHDGSVYVDPELATQPVFGLIRVRFTDVLQMYESCNNPSAYVRFLYAFPNRSSFWRYYICIKDPGSYFDPDGRKLTIDSSATPYTFKPGNAGPTPGFSIGDYHTVVVASSITPIPFKEIPVSQLFLKEDDGTPVLLSPLPNASYTTVESNRLDPLNDPPDAASEIFVFIDTLP